MTYKVAFNFADGKTQFCEVREGEILLDAALRSGIKIPLDCREGVCATCQGRCESGSYTQEYVDEEALSAKDIADRMILSCQTKVQSDASFYFDFDSALVGGGDATTFRGTVSNVVQISETTAGLDVVLDEGIALPHFLPGQYARIRVPGSDSIRSYSFANAPGQRLLKFLVRLLPDGAMSNYLRDRARQGDSIEMQLPLGAFYLRQIDRPIIMAAGGTGLSAFLAMLDQIAAQRANHQTIHLYYGVRRSSDLCELERIETYRSSIPGFSYTLVVTEPNPDWNGKIGFIPPHLDASPYETGNFDIYVCGPPPMVESIKEWKDANGTESTRIFLEKFTESNT